MVRQHRPGGGRLGAGARAPPARARVPDRAAARGVRRDASVPFGGRPAALFGYVEGRHPDPRSPRALAAVGAALARLHQLTGGLELAAPRRRKDAGEGLREATEAHRARGVGPEEPRLARFVRDVECFREQLDERIARAAAGLPRGVVHEDAHAGNLLVDADDRLLALLDFDDARPTFLIADVAGLAVWWGVESRNHRIVPAWATAAVAAYTPHRTLTGDEWEVRPDFMAQYDLLSATAYVAWRIRTGMAPEQPVEWCSSYARFQEFTARDDWCAAIRHAIRSGRPKHGSWLKMVEAEIALVSRQALDQRLPDADAVRPVIAAWGASAQRRPGDGHLALHRHGRPAQAQAPVSDLIHPADH